MTHTTPDAEPIVPASSESAVAGWIENQVRNTPWWLISIAFHLIVLAGMTVVTFKENIKAISNPTVIEVARQEGRMDPPTRPVDDFSDRKKGFSTVDMTNLPEENDDVVLPPWDAEDSDHNETKNNMDTHTMKGDSLDFFGHTPGNTGGLGRSVGGPGSTDVEGVGKGGGSGGMHGDPFGGGNRNCRKIGPSGNGKVTRETEDAVKHGLWWLGRHQNANGSWSANSFNAQCNGAKCEGDGYSEYDAGETGLALLAYLGAGYTHLSRETYKDPVTRKTMSYAEAVKSAVKWLVANQDTEGCFGGRHGSKYMYNHAIAALAMAEAYGLTGSSIFRDSAQRGIDFLQQAQNPYKAWRYSKQCDDNDTSVTGWAVMALKSANMAGLAVSRTAFDGAKAWILEVTNDTTSRVGYTSKDTGKVVVKGKNEDFDDHPALSAVGMLCRIFIDHNEKDPALVGGAQLMMADLPGYGAKKTDYYYWYYGSLALFQYDGPKGPSFNAWNDAMKKALLPSQNTEKDGCESGSWDVDVDRWGFEGGRVYTTAINTLTLEVYYRYASAFGGHH